MVKTPYEPLHIISKQTVELSSLSLSYPTLLTISSSFFYTRIKLKRKYKLVDKELKRTFLIFFAS